MLPIGDHFTMSPREAAYACKLLQPETVIPMHYGTFPQLTGTPIEFRKLVENLVRNIEVVEMKPGQTISGSHHPGSATSREKQEEGAA
jgi:L-ascorbate metabolism protein UlaG (beta-lactamase superfamily)